MPVPPTHYYVRFLPANEKQYKILENEGYVLLDHPMDYEIVRDGDWYHDPEVPEGQITWQYAVVPADAFHPRFIRREILHACYIPADREATKSDDGIDWAAVERESFRLTGNEALLEEAPTKAGGGESTPSGRITIVDPARGGEAEGVRGVRIACNVFVKTAYTFTDEDGRYRMSQSFSGKPRYRLIFKNSAGFNIGFNLLLGPASVSSLGNGEATGLDVQIRLHPPLQREFAVHQDAAVQPALLAVPGAGRELHRHAAAGGDHRQRPDRAAAGHLFHPVEDLPARRHPRAQGPGRLR